MWVFFARRRYACMQCVLSASEAASSRRFLTSVAANPLLSTGEDLTALRGDIPVEVKGRNGNELQGHCGQQCFYLLL